MEPNPRNPERRQRRGRTGAIALLSLLIAFIASTSPVIPGVVSFVSSARAEELWQATVTPIEPTPCANVMSVTPALGLCTDIGVAQRTTDKIKNAIYFNLLTAAIYGFLDAATYMAQTMAYDTASWIAEGGPASGPLFYGKSFEDYLSDVGKDAVGEFVATLSEDFTSEFGLNLCKPPNWEAINLQLALSIPDIAIPLKRPTPRCPWTQLTENWESAASSLSNADALANIGATFQMGGNDLSYAVNLHAPLLDMVAGKEQAAILDRLEGAGYRSVKDYVTGDIKTPSQTVREQFHQQLIYQPAENEAFKRSAVVSNAFQLGFVEIGKATISTFVNTLASKLLSKVMKGLFQPSSQGASGTLDLTNPFAAPRQSTQPQQIFAEQFKDILTPRLTPVEEQNLLAELQASCVGSGRTKWSCAIDSNLALALTQGGMTVREALDKGFINPNARLIPSSQIEDNQDPTCASNGDRFCVANLRKLRLARVIPVGWELAAESSVNQVRCSGGDGCMTFGEVASKFDDCNYDVNNGGSVGGTLDQAHPWCHLIDPNWVLAAFPAKCMVKGYGNSLLTGTAERLYECQDTVTCLKRDANGKCTGGYGYCLGEQPYWQFDAQSCKEEFVSCRMFTPRGANAKPIGYLRSTLDYGTCSASNVGCMWYATTRNPSAGENAWTATYGGTQGKVYLDASAATCDAKNDGCTELRVVRPGEHAVNLVRNGSFEETDQSAAGELVGWRRFMDFQTMDGTRVSALNDQGPSVTNGSPAADGSRGLVPPVAPSIGQVVRFNSGRQYTISYYARRNGGAPSQAGLTIHFYPALSAGPNAIPSKGISLLTSDTSFYRSSGCTSSGVRGGRASQVNVAVPNTIGDDWERFECSFVPPQAAAWGTIFLVNGNASAPLIDAVKLEEAEIATPFAEGLNQNLETVHMKIPPAELGCSGADTDNPLCASFARVCRENEAGCMGYRLKRQPGSPEIPAVLTSVDVCPAECVGYAEFRKQPSTFDYTHNPDLPLVDDPADETIAHFIPDTARFCTVEDVGCEQFTNLSNDTAAAYSYLRSCVAPGDASQTYYSWEGSEETGFQLRTWSMVRDLTAPAPQGPRVLQKPGPDGMLKNPSDCNADTYLRGFDPDCRQFYDPQGNVFYRYESQTVLSDPECAQYRLDRSNEADCRLTGGSFNPQTNSCTYEALGSKSKSCSASVAGCRGYVGTAGKSQAVVWSEEFLDDGYATRIIGTQGAVLSRSDESILVGDSSLKIVPGPSGAVQFDVPTEPGVLYEIGFWAKRTGPPEESPITANGAQIGTVNLGSEWGVYRFGPFAGGSDPTTRIQISAFGNAAVFMDKIRVERVSDVTYVIKNSWQTPAVCDQTPEGNPEPRAMLGCEAYVDRNNNTVNARQFSRLCRESAIGCTGYVNTENTESPYEERWTKPGAGSTTEVTVKPGDHYDYFIPERSKMCPESADGCRAFGRPQFTQDRLSLKSDAPFTTVYLKDDPAAYGDSLCSEPELFCESFAYSAARESGTAYFRAPSDHACEWKEGVIVGQTCGLSATDAARFAGRSFDGWFRVGTDCPCSPDRLVQGSAFGIRYTGDDHYNEWLGSASSLYPTGETYRGWTATCPTPQAECTELRDTNDRSDTVHPMGRPYFVIKDDQLDDESCNGQVDPGNGCVLFQDTSDNRLLYSSAATQHAYRERGYRPVSPVDCVGNPEHPSCEADFSGSSSYPAYCLENGTRICQGLIGEELADCLRGNAQASGPSHICNDANLVVKVKPDRTCSQWLACKTGETVYDEASGSYKNICSELELCNASGETGGEGIPFCTSYVDREDERNTIFQPYVVTDAATYADRPVGFGAVDYSGLTIPDHFQVMDTRLEPVGSFLALDPLTSSALKKDYRLTVAIPLSSPLVRRARDGDTGVLASAGEYARYACVYDQTGALGLVTTPSGELTTSREGDDLCWLAVDQEKPPAIGGIASTVVSDNLVVPFLARRFEQGTNPTLDQMLSRAFPNTKCKASPEANAPFGNAFVIEWDDSVSPPQAKRVLDGYANANFCEYGEDCECVYKRISYRGPVKYYAPLSTEVVNAICLGGPRDGLPCIADVGVQGSEAPGGGATGTASVNYQSSHAQANEQCGSGMCTPLSDSTLVRGMTGQCLQFDISRPHAGGNTESECLVWNPNPILTGPGDQYHWQPTAGFQPPQSSGRYYCSSPVRKPRSQQFWPFSWRPDDVPREGFNWKSLALAVNPYSGPLYATYKTTTDYTSLMTGASAIGTGVGCGDDMSCISPVGFMLNSAGTYAGSIKALFYADWYASDGTCVNFLFVGGCTGNESGASLDGTSASSMQEGGRCENIDDEDQAFIYKTDAMRLVTTGHGTNRSYAEYAFLINPVHVAYAALGYVPTDPETILDYSTEDAVANLEFSVPKEKIGCGYSEVWADAHVDDYNKKRDKWKGGDDAWHANFQNFLQEGGGKLDRSRAQIVTEDGSETGIPVKVECVLGGDEDRAPDDGLCYMKTWQIDYRAEGSEKFMAFTPDIARDSLDHLSRRPLYGKCESAHPWFSIRAVFEDTNVQENELDPLEVTPAQLTGPFQFVGLWVTACAPGNETRYIYMNMKMNSADVCRELLETISKDSHDSAVFTDRNSAASGYALKNGFSWNTTNIPFGASLANGTAGKQPLYMSGVRQSEVNPLNPPTFTYPGQTYFQSTTYPTSNWGLLSNVFARIYRIYGYNVRGVGRNDWACTNPESPQFGQWCPNLDRVGDTETEDADAIRARLAREYCGYEGKCVRGSTDAANLFAAKACNAFSGVNRGLDCSADPDICHIAPMEEVDGVPTPRYGACVLFQGYIPPDDDHGDEIDARWESVNRNYRCRGTDCPSNGSGVNCTWDGVAGSTGETGCSRTDAVLAGAFRCEGSVRDVGLVKQTIDGNTTYASYCTKESQSSHECPAYLPAGTCNIEDGQEFGTCAGSPWAQCAADEDCHFLARNWWPSGESNDKFQTVAANTGGTNHRDGWYPYMGYMNKAFVDPHRAYPESQSGFFYAQGSGSSVGLRAVENHEAARAAFYPAVPYDLQYTEGNYAYSDQSYSKLFPTWIAPERLGSSATTLTYDSWDDLDLMQLQPGFNPLIFWSTAYYSYNVGTYAPSSLSPLTLTVDPDVPPYVSFDRSSTWGADQMNQMVAHYGACESISLMFRDSDVTSTITGGTCRGGTRAGASCSNDTDCRPTGVDNSDAEDWCHPVTSGPNADQEEAYAYTNDSRACWPNYSATNPRNPRFEEDTAKDSNICTHPPGYWPRPNYCQDPTDEYCGLFGYDLMNRSESVSDDRPLPTDVTAGLYTPRFLNPSVYGPESTIHYNYVDYYNPEPPHTAAPDIRTCQGRRCRVAGLDTLSLDGNVGGVANGGVGNHVATLRFYAWASHEQMPLRRVVIDWGDGSTSELPDAYMKNRKPYCSTTKECTDTPGLTCETDNDCPPGGGSCQSYGNCSNSPNTKCYNDNQCAIGGEQGTCERRTYFGNDQDACDEQYLEFRHAYACADGALDDCAQAGGRTAMRCSRDNTRTCDDASDCAVGDTCVESIAEPGGCFDQANNRCLYTPRVMIIDNWGWCSGECRNATNQNGVLIDANNEVLHPNGGCYDASRVKNNVDFEDAIGVNECALDTAGSTDRPWIVFPGSLQLLPGQEL